MPNSFSQNVLPKLRFTSKEEAYLKILQSIVETYVAIGKSKEIENRIRNRIVLYLQNEHYFFAPLYQNERLEISPEYYNLLSETDTNRPDICFSLGEINGILIGRFIIECKRLYKYPSHNKPYLDDGLIKFIDLRYSPNNQYAGMLGFVVSGDIDTIFEDTKINTENFHPTNPKQPVQCPIDSKWKHGFISFHERIDKSEIKIYHLLFEFKEKS